MTSGIPQADSAEPHGSLVTIQICIQRISSLKRQDIRREKRPTKPIPDGGFYEMDSATPGPRFCIHAGCLLHRTRSGNGAGLLFLSLLHPDRRILRLWLRPGLWRLWLGQLLPARSLRPSRFLWPVQCLRPTPSLQTAHFQWPSIPLPWRLARRRDRRIPRFGIPSRPPLAI